MPYVIKQVLEFFLWSDSLNMLKSKNKAINKNKDSFMDNVCVYENDTTIVTDVTAKNP